MSNHTPGPWTVYEADDDRPGIEAGDAGAAEITSVILWGDPEKDDDDAGVRGRTSAEVAANARLIAAAPDMYEALKTLAELFEINVLKQSPSFTFPVGEAAYKAALAALAKAAGK